MKQSPDTQRLLARGHTTSTRRRAITPSGVIDYVARARRAVSDMDRTSRSGMALCKIQVFGVNADMSVSERKRRDIGDLKPGIYVDDALNDTFTRYEHAHEVVAFMRDRI